MGQAPNNDVHTGNCSTTSKHVSKENKPRIEERTLSPRKGSNPNLASMKSRNSPRANSEERKKPRSYVHMNTKRASPSYHNRHNDYNSNNHQSRNYGSNRSTPNDEYVDVQSNFPANSGENSMGIIFMSRIDIMTKIV